jgi:spore coat protein CotH
MAQHGLSEDGNVYKAVNHDANFKLTNASGDPKNTLHDGYEKKDGEPADDFSDMDDLVSFAATSTSSVFLAEVDTRLRRADYENWFILVTAIMADDSAGKNSYHYHDPLGGPWRFAPWDFNDCFGQSWRTLREQPTLERTYFWNNRLFERFLAEPTIADPLVARYARVLNDQYDLDAVLALVDQYTAEIDISARRDQTKWGDAYRSYSGWNNRDDFTDYDGEIDYVRSWIVQRWTYLQTIYPE